MKFKHESSIGLALILVENYKRNNKLYPKYITYWQLLDSQFSIFPASLISSENKNEMDPVL